MGCWGITAFESDAGLDAVAFIKEQLPRDGMVELGKILEALKQDEWNAPPEIKEAPSHTSVMALAEVMVKLLDRDFRQLDYDDKFCNLTSFTAFRESVRWLRDYLSETLHSHIEHAKFDGGFGGWFKEKDWIGWQKHMSALVERFDTMLTLSGDYFELISPQLNEAEDVHKQSNEDSNRCTHVHREGFSGPELGL